MIVTRTSRLTGVVRERELDVTADQLDRLERGSESIQRVIPHLSADDREFIMTGITAQEWADLVGVEEDDE